MRYYEEVDRLTYHEAGRLVVEWIESTERSTVTARRVAELTGVEPTRHNVLRISAALDACCDVIGEGPKRFKL